MAEPTVLGGRYRIESLLGRGGMAQVYLGTDPVLDRRVAVKILAPEFARDTSFVTRFRREARAAAALSHPNVVGIYDTGSDDGVHYIVMEYIRGRTLAEALHDGPLLPERAVEVAGSVAGGLSFAHRNGIVHRDVKPGNIMLTPGGDVKVMDFGIARATSAESLTQTATVLGTAAYFSPEQAQGQPVDARSDIYALGCVLYEMVTGSPPFTGDTALAVAYKHVRETPTPPSRRNRDVSPALDAVILKCLSKNADNRYQTADELREDLQRIQRGQPVGATPLLGEPTAATAYGAPTGRSSAASTEYIPRTSRPTTVLPTAPPGPRDGRGGRGWVIAAAIVVILGLLVALLFLLAGDLLQNNDAPPTPVMVPNVVGLELPVAQSRLQQEGFDSDVARQAPSDAVPENAVIDYEPKVGVPGEDVIQLTVSTGPTVERVEVPNVLCATESDARAALAGVGLEVEVAGEEQNPDCADEGTVARTDPESGTEVDEGATVRIWLVPGNPPEPPSAPNLASGSDSGRSNEDNVTNQTTLTFDGTAQPDVQITLFRDGAQVGTTTSDGSGNWSVQDSDLGDGTFTYTARATDDENRNSEMSDGTEVRVDTSAPDTTITDQPPPETTETTATFSFEASEDDAAFECQLDGDGFSECSSPETYDDLAIGEHTFEVRATDVAGNTDQSPASYTWLVIAV
jgi:tRNA A-37 threonylcarbamoyl transferase component Bud32